VVSTTEVRAIEAFKITVGKDVALNTVIAYGKLTPAITMTSGAVSDA